MVDNVNVNVAPAQTPQWVNADSLRVKFGRGEAELGRGGEYMAEGHILVSEIDIDFAVMALGTDATHNVIFDYDLVFPAGAIIERCTFTVGTAWAGASMTLNFGLMARNAAGSTVNVIVDADGLMDSFPTTVIDLAGNIVVTEPPGGYPDVTTYVGALLGTALASDSVVSGFWETAVPTAGTGKLRIFWRHNA